MKKIIKIIGVLSCSLLCAVGGCKQPQPAIETRTEIRHIETSTQENVKIFSTTAAITPALVQKTTVKANHFMNFVQKQLMKFQLIHRRQEQEPVEVFEDFITEAIEEEIYYEEIEPVVVETYDYSPREYEPDYFEIMGILEWGGWRWTWYSQQVLPGGGLDIPGRHVDSDGYVCDENDYICLASDYLEWGTVVNTPFGKMGRVYDCGPGAWDILDVYVDW